MKAKPKKVEKEKCAAVLTIYRPGEMSPKGRKAIAAWLRDKADHFEAEGDKYDDKRFTARYLYR